MAADERPDEEREVRAHHRPAAAEVRQLRAEEGTRVLETRSRHVARGRAIHRFSGRLVDSEAERALQPAHGRAREI